MKNKININRLFKVKTNDVLTPYENFDNKDNTHYLSLNKIALKDLDKMHRLGFALYMTDDIDPNVVFDIKVLRIDKIEQLAIVETSPAYDIK